MTEDPTKTPAPTAPMLPDGWSTFAPEGWGSTAMYNPTAAQTAFAGRSNPNPATTFGTANPQGLINNGFYNVTDFLKTQAGGADIQPMFYNPETGMWGVWNGNRAGHYTITNTPQLMTTVPNESSVGGMLKDAWGNGFGMAMSPFLAGLGGGVTGGASDVGTDVYAGESMNAGAGTYGTVGGGATGAGAGMLSLDALGRQFGTNLLQSGGNVKGALRNTAVGAGVSAGANLAADGINSVFAPTNAPSRFGNDVMFDAGLEDQALGDTMKRRFSFDADLNDSSLGAAMSARTPLMPPAVLDTGGRGMMPTPVLDTGGQPMMPTPLAPHSPGMLSSPIPMSAIASTPPSVEAQPSAEQQQPQAPAPSQEVVNAQQLVNLSKIGSALARMNAGRGQPEDAPQRQEGQTDAQYEQTLADYAHIDPQVLSDAGVTPGTPEYYQFVMSQLDSVISQITDGLDPDDASLSDKLRTKSREELDALERALFVRGQLGQLMGSGQYTDPFTGTGEDVNTNGAQVNPSVAAYHRGLYRSAGELSHMDPLDARKYVGGMLDRSPDLFGMQATHNARTLDEMLSQQNMDPEDIRRRRGMFGQDPFANLGSMSERDLEATLASLLH